MENMTWISAPIDDKNVINEFDWLFGYDYREEKTTVKSLYKGTFKCKEVKWEYSYNYGNSRITMKSSVSKTEMVRLDESIIALLKRVSRCNEETFMTSIIADYSVKRNITVKGDILCEVEVLFHFHQVE